jgi:hypothetical protein
MAHLSAIACVCCHHRKTDLPPALDVRPFVDPVRRLLRPLLTPAAPSRRLAAPVAHLLPGARRQISQGNARDLRAIYLAHLRPPLPGDIRASGFLAPSPRGGRLICASCSSGRHFACSFLQTPSHDDALAVRLTVPITRAREGLPPPSLRPDTNSVKSCPRTYAPCLAHQEKGRRNRCRPFIPSPRRRQVGEMTSQLTRSTKTS